MALDPKDQGREERVRLPIALDLSVSPDFDGSAAEKKVYGPLYGSMICTFVNAIGQSHFSKEPVLIFIDPKNYIDYNLASERSLQSGRRNDLASLSIERR